MTTMTHEQIVELVNGVYDIGRETGLPVSPEILDAIIMHGMVELTDGRPQCTPKGDRLCAAVDGGDNMGDELLAGRFGYVETESGEFVRK